MPAPDRLMSEWNDMMNVKVQCRPDRDIHVGAGDIVVPFTIYMGTRGSQDSVGQHLILAPLP
jgi:hypothetical protein